MSARNSDFESDRHLSISSRSNQSRKSSLAKKKRKTSVSLIDKYKNHDPRKTNKSVAFKEEPRKTIDEK